MWDQNITGLDNAGTFRSLNGAANESIFQGRASKAGYFCFFKVWRDMPYDAVLDHDGNMYRVEVKGTNGDHFDVTRGGRSGAQIKRGKSRERLIKRDDCDFVVGVDSANGDCYIIPTDIIEIINRKSLHKEAVIDFKEKWDLFKFEGDNCGSVNRMTKEQTRDGLRNLPLAEVNTIASGLGVTIPAGDIKINRHRVYLSDPMDKLIYAIWTKLAGIK